MSAESRGARASPTGRRRLLVDSAARKQGGRQVCAGVERAGGVRAADELSAVAAPGVAVHTQLARWKSSDDDTDTRGGPRLFVLFEVPCLHPLNGRRMQANPLRTRGFIGLRRAAVVEAPPPFTL